MSKEEVVRHRSALGNRVLFVINLAFLLLIALAWLLPRYRIQRLAAKQAHDLGMKLYFGRPPFFLFVAKGFPSNETFTLLQKGRPLVVSGKRCRSTAQKDIREVTVSFGPDFSISAQYTLLPEMKMTECTMSFESFAVTDLNADGFPDMRVSWDPVQRLEIWYQGQWNEVRRGEDGGKTRRRLLDGTPVTFDASKGVWVRLK